MSNEIKPDWSQASLVTVYKSQIKKTFGSPSKSSQEKGKEKKETTRMTIAKLFALHANAKKTTTKAIAKLFALYANAIK